MSRTHLSIALGVLVATAGPAGPAPAATPKKAPVLVLTDRDVAHVDTGEG